MPFTHRITIKLPDPVNALLRYTYTNTLYTPTYLLIPLLVPAFHQLIELHKLGLIRSGLFKVHLPLKSLDVSLVLFVKSTFKQGTRDSNLDVDFQTLWHYFSLLPNQSLVDARCCLLSGDFLAGLNPIDLLPHFFEFSLQFFQVWLDLMEIANH